MTDTANQCRLGRNAWSMRISPIPLAWVSYLSNLSRSRGSQSVDVGQNWDLSGVRLRFVFPACVRLICGSTVGQVRRYGSLTVVPMHLRSSFRCLSESSLPCVDKPRYHGIAFAEAELESLDKRAEI
jgi:hypothetical protein